MTAAPVHACIDHLQPLKLADHTSWVCFHCKWTALPSFFSVKLQDGMLDRLTTNKIKCSVACTCVTRQSNFTSQQRYGMPVCRSVRLYTTPAGENCRVHHTRVQVNSLSTNQKALEPGRRESWLWCIRPFLLILWSWAILLIRLRQDPEPLR